MIIYVCLYVCLKRCPYLNCEFYGVAMDFHRTVSNGKIFNEVSDSLDEDVEWYFIGEAKFATVSDGKRRKVIDRQLENQKPETIIGC